MAIISRSKKKTAELAKLQKISDVQSERLNKLHILGVNLAYALRVPYQLDLRSQALDAWEQYIDGLVQEDIQNKSV